MAVGRTEMMRAQAGEGFIRPQRRRPAPAVSSSSPSVKSTAGTVNLSSTAYFVDFFVTVTMYMVCVFAPVALCLIGAANAVTSSLLHSYVPFWDFFWEVVEFVAPCAFAVYLAVIVYCLGRCDVYPGFP